MVHYSSPVQKDFKWMTTKELVHDSNVCFKGLLVKPSMVHIRETQIFAFVSGSRLSASRLSLGINPHRIQFLTCDSYRLSPVLALAPVFRIGSHYRPLLVALTGR